MLVISSTSRGGELVEVKEELELEEALVVDEEVNGHQVVYSVTTPLVVVVIVDSTAEVECVVTLPNESVLVNATNEVVQSVHTEDFVESTDPLLMYDEEPE